MKHTLETYPAREYSTRNRKRHTAARRVVLSLAALAALAVAWVILAL